MPAPGVTTLGTIRAQCQQRSDNVNQGFIASSEWDSYIQASYQELYALVVEAFGNDYFVQSPASGYTLTTDGVNQFFSLPSDFFKLLGVDLQVSSPFQWVTLKQFAFSERNNLSSYNSSIPMAGQALRVFYVPRLTLPTQSADVIDGVNGWEEYIVADSCIKALAKEESDVSVFMAQKAAVLKRLESEIENRNASGDAGAIADTRGRQARAMRYRLNGNQLWLIGGSTPGWAPSYGDWGADGDFGGSW